MAEHDAPVTTATLTFEPGTEDVIRSIVRDEIEKLLSEKKQDATKALLGAVTKAAFTAMSKAKQEPKADKPADLGTRRFI